MHGGCVCIPSEQERASDPGAVMRKMSVNWCFLTPTVASLLKPSDVPDLRTLTLGGEAIRKENVDVWAGSVRLLNSYGPAEGSICCAVTPLFRKDCNPNNFGRALPSARLWVVSPENHKVLVPIGAVGELLIEGPILALGYLNDEEKTSAAFVDDLSWALVSPGAMRRRFYKTGDMVRYNSDGRLCFSGRRDGQIKVRGQRVEVGEIEYQLSKVSKSSSSAIVLPGHGPFEKRLVGLLSLPGSTHLLPGSTAISQVRRSQIPEAKKHVHVVRDHLEQSLPSYMIPTTWIVVDAIPLLSSGKINRALIQRWLEAFSSSDVAQQAELGNEDAGADISPFDTDHNGLRDIWAAVLNVPVESISPQRSFFSLGGDSISAMQVASRCRAVGINITLTHLLKFKTIAALSSQLRATTATAAPVAVGADNTGRPFVSSPVRRPILEQLQAALSDFPCSRLTSDDFDALLSKRMPTLQGLHGLATIFQCSPMQQALLLSQEASPDLYRIITVFRISRQDFKPERLLGAWQHVVDRNPILRTIIIPSSSETGKWEQAVFQNAIADTFTSTLEPEQLVPELRRAPRVVLGSESRPLHRFGLSRSKDGEYYCVLDINHIFVDGTSSALLMQDLRAAYESESALGPGPSFEAYVSHLQAQPMPDALAYWKRYLQGVSPCQFPNLVDIEQPRMERQPNILSVDVAMPDPVAMRAFCSENDLTISNIVSVAWAALLKTYLCNQRPTTDICFGYLVSGRHAPVPGIEDMVGPLINMLACRIAFADSTQLQLELCRKVQDDMADALAFHYCPLAEVEHTLRHGQKRLFDTAISVQKDQRGTSRGTIDFEEVGGQDPSEYTMVLNVLEGISVLHASIDFQTSRISPVFARSIAATLSAILSQILETPHATVGDFNALSKSDREQILAWGSELPESRCIGVHETFRTQAVARPHAPAIASTEMELSYAELDALSTELAASLQASTSPIGSYVPLLFEKSAWAAVASLAVLKYGAAFVPLDPSHPPSRLKEILQQTGATSMLCSSRFSNLAHSLVEHAIVVTQSTLHVQARVDPRLGPQIPSSDPAYVLFTSGSTGTPKGVVISHAALSTSIHEHGPAMNFGQETRTLQFAAYAFDASIAETFTTLCWGGCVCIPSDQERMNDVSSFMKQWSVNWLFSTPSFLRTLEPQKCDTIATIALGGEAIPVSLLTLWSTHANVIQCYGPTETTIFCSMTDPLVHSGEIVSIGHPKGSVNWIVDPSNIDRLVPIGAVGELLIEGPTVAEGYLNDLTKTNMSFVEAPQWMSEFGPGRGKSRFYRSGDLVRYDSRTGSMTFVARIDNQVKIRGQR
jgi:amino acid adenylation domain-containing protein